MVIYIYYWDGNKELLKKKLKLKKEIHGNDNMLDKCGNIFKCFLKSFLLTRAPTFYNIYFILQLQFHPNHCLISHSIVIYYKFKKKILMIYHQTQNKNGNERNKKKKIIIVSLN